MRSGHRAVVFGFTLILTQVGSGWSGSAAHAAAVDFLTDCKTVPADAQPRMVVGRRPAEEGKAILAAVGQTGIYETRDGGDTWALLTPAGACHREIRAFWENNPDGDTLCVVTTPGGGGFNTYCSNDRGRSWEPQTWIRDAEHVLFDPSDASRAFGWTPHNQCKQICSGPTYTIAMSHAKSTAPYCACNLQLAVSAGAHPHLFAVRDSDNSRQNRLVTLADDLKETLVIRETDPNRRLLHLYTNPGNEDSFVATYATRTPLGEEAGLCCDGLYESSDRGRSMSKMVLPHGPLESVQFTSIYGDLVALVRPQHARGITYIGRKYFNLAEWTWTRAPEAEGSLLAAGELLYFAGRHLYRVDTTPYTVIDPVN